MFLYNILEKELLVLVFSMLVSRKVVRDKSIIIKQKLRQLNKITVISNSFLYIENFLYIININL